MTIVTRMQDSSVESNVNMAGEGTEAWDRCCPQRILVVDEHELVQAGMRAVLANESWVSACFVAGSAPVAWEVARRHQPQLLLLSMSLHGRSGLELCRVFKQRTPYLKVLLTSADGRVSASLASAYGADGFVPLSMPAAGISAVIRRVAEGGRTFPKQSYDVLSSQLSRRELDVLRLLVSGASNPEAAVTLCLSKHTVKQHTSSVYRKLGVRNRAQAASRARELGLVS